MDILLVIDDDIPKNMIKDFLLDLKYNLDVAYDSDEGEEYIYNNKYNLFLFDIKVINLLKKLRINDDTTPVIILNGENNATMIQQCYEMGCDDYIKKPFVLKELELRINYIKKIYHLENSKCIMISDKLKLDMSNFSIIKENKTIFLPRKEAQIIKYFLQHENKIINTCELIINIWEYGDEPSIATIRTYIKNIKKVIGSEYFTSIKNVGYRFNRKIIQHIL